MLEGATLKGRYRLDRLIGGDGRRGVYQATDLHLSRNVAIKVVAFAQGANREELAARDRFRARAATAAKVRHPNLVAVHEVGTDEPLGLDFVVMELLRGDDLQREAPRDRPLPWADAARILGESARGLGAGHRLGLVHGGLTPASLFLARNGSAEPPHVRVLDLGTALLPASRNGASAPPAAAASQGPYAAPEQRRGGEPTAAADVWGLAVAAYELLTGTLPFTDRQRAELARGGRVPPLAASRLNPTVPAAADALLARSLDPDPALRPPDGEAFARELDVILHAPPAPPAPPPDRPGARTGTPAGAAGPRTTQQPRPSAPSPAPPAPTPSTPRTPSTAPAAPTPSGDSAAPAPAPDRRRRRWVMGLAGLACAAVVAVAVAVLAGLTGEQKGEYFANARPIALSREDAPGEIDHIKALYYRRIEDGHPMMERRMALGRWRRFEWPSADSAHATVYEDGGGIQKIRVRVYESGTRTSLLFYYEAGELAFVHEVVPTGGDGRLEERFYFHDRALILWRDTRNEPVPLSSGGYDERSRKFLRISDRIYELASRAH